MNTRTKRLSYALFCVLTAVGLYLLIKIFLLPNSVNVGGLKIIMEDVLSDKPGYDSLIETERAEYYYNEAVKEQSKAVLLKCEAVLHAAKKDFGLEIKTPKILIKETGKAYLSTVFKNENLVVSLSDVYSTGFVFSRITNGKVPTWLCAGLELYWMEEYGLDTGIKKADLDEWILMVQEKDLPLSLDSWFCGYFPDMDLTTQAFDIARQFVAYLDKEKILMPLVRSFLDDDYAYSPELPDEWNVLIKRGKVYPEHDYYTSGSDVCIYSPNAIYRLNNDVDLNYHSLIRLIEDMDETLEFTKNWLEVEIERCEIIISEKTPYTGWGYEPNANIFRIRINQANKPDNYSFLTLLMTLLKSGINLGYMNNTDSAEYKCFISLFNYTNASILADSGEAVDINSYYGGSFGEYLFLQFGKKKCVEVILDYTMIENIFGKTADELLQEWEEYTGL